MGNWGSGMWDPFLGGGVGGGVFRLIAKFAVLFLGKKMMPAISMRMLHEHPAHRVILKVPDVLGSIAL